MNVDRVKDYKLSWVSQTSSQNRFTIIAKISRPNSIMTIQTEPIEVDTISLFCEDLEPFPIHTVTWTLAIQV